MKGSVRQSLIVLLVAGAAVLPGLVQPLHAQTAAPQSAAVRTADLPSDPFDLTDEEIDILQSLAARREALAERERALDARADLLKAAEARLEQRIEALESLKKDVESLVAAHRAESVERIAGLVKIYASMKPKEAAPILAGMELSVLIPVMQAMPARNAAAILAEMRPQQAENITVEMAATDGLPAARD